MGSFSEVVLGFSLRPDTPEHVLAAFSALAVPTPASSFAPPAPVLPPPHQIEGDDGGWEPNAEFADPAEDPQPWRHDWALWFSQSMTGSVTPSAQMVWSEMGRWTVSCRWGIKTWPDAIVPALRWLGPFLETDDENSLLGYIRHEYLARPVLVWLTPEGAVEAEDLNVSSGSSEP